MLKVMFFYAMIIIIMYGLHSENTVTKPEVLSGKGIKQETREVCSPRDIARISYPKAIQKLGSLSFLLTKPQRFEQEGIYIWRDSDGVWNVQRISNRELILKGEIFADKAIEIVAMTETRNIDFNKIDKNKVVLYASGVPEKEEIIFKFKVIGNYLDFDLYVNGSHNTRQIFLGSKIMNPLVIPFRLDNPPIKIKKSEINKTSTDVNFIYYSDSNIGIKQDNTPFADFTKSSGSSGGCKGR